MNVLASPLFSEIDTGLAKAQKFSCGQTCTRFLIFAPGTTRYILHEKSKKFQKKIDFIKAL